jgi:hypothetical protein
LEKNRMSCGGHELSDTLNAYNGNGTHRLAVVTVNLTAEYVELNT